MTVYAESNFVLEQALQQEEGESCEAIVKLASASRISLVIPAFSLAEPHEVITRKDKARSRLGIDLRAHLSELGRSKPHRWVRASFWDLTELLISVAQSERDRLRETMTLILKTAEIIPLDAVILSLAIEIQSAHGLSGQDSIVLASVLTHLGRQRPRESCFLNRNRKDFGEPGVRGRLDASDCLYFASFNQGLQYITSRTSELP